ncbi:microcin C transport system substrate-binding protein [Rhodobacter sp. JA431]|uniref:extracellular solute-binding protein n=1 Tax=Rhodobacter sp. JA431 TaxID=570013 RepID=UPI000BDBBB0C|nr:extracellular solute-binding protein [Rhodobacter sp. JA431]SOC19996.1 microcin C transport system substrate-binding protein [Rhodobacter sp. JA431]
MARVAVAARQIEERGRFLSALGAGLVALALAGGVATQVRAADTVSVAAIATLGDVKYDSGFSHLDYVNPEAPKGGEISEWAPGAFDNFNPFTIKGRAAALASAPLETMLTGTADTVGEAYCLLCESFEYPESKDWVIFTLRDGITFSDGTPLTVADVLFSYEQMRDKGLSSFRAVVAQQIAGAEVLDDRRIKFTFTADAPRRDIIQLAGGLPVFSKAQFENAGLALDEPSQVALIGSGPYVFDSAKDGRTVVWKRNPDYWGETLPINVGRNNFDRIRVEYYGDYQAAFEGFKSGSYTFRNETSSIIWATQYDFPAMTSGHVVKDELHDGNVASGQAFAINLRREKFADIRVREAIGLMFNFEWSNESLFYGLYARINSIWENSPLAASGAPGPEELALLEPFAADLPEGVLNDEAVMAPVSGARQLDRRNMRRAAALLDEAGWEVGDDGMRRNAQGALLTVEFLNDSQSFDRVINPFVENLRALGVDAKMARVDDAQYEARRRSHDFDLITTHFGQDLIPGSGLQQYFGSGAVGDVFNAAGLANPAVDALIRKVEEAQTQEELLPRVQALDRVLRALRFWVPQWYKDKYTVAYYDMYEHPETLPPYTLGETDFWWYNAEKAAKLKAEGAI